jgi:hypothetical protein
LGRRLRLKEGEQIVALKEYKPGSAFTGVIGRTFDVSEPACLNRP